MKQKVYYFYGNGGSLRSCLRGRKLIFKEDFDTLIKHKIYKYYTFDERINADVYKLRDHNLNFCLPLFIGCFYWNEEPEENIKKILND